MAITLRSDTQLASSAMTRPASSHETSCIVGLQPCDGGLSLSTPGVLTAGPSVASPYFLVVSSGRHP
jgi:hypothetical protein